MNHDLLTGHRAAQLLGVKESTLRRWRHLGKGPAYVKVGTRAVRYAPSALDDFIAQCEKIDPSQNNLMGVN